MGPGPARGGPGNYYFGVYPAVVTDIEDPDNLARVEVRIPVLGVEGGSDLRLWATLCSPYAGESQGLIILPEVGSQVVVAFEAGDMHRPYVLGSTWNRLMPLPHAPEASNNIRMLRTRSDSRLEFDDAVAGPKVSMTTHSGHQVVLDAGASEVTITHSNGSTITLTASGSIEISANSSVNVRAASVKVDAPMSTFSGVVSCQTLMASEGVVSPSYTPGAGNIW